MTKKKAPDARKSIKTKVDAKKALTKTTNDNQDVIDLEEKLEAELHLEPAQAAQAVEIVRSVMVSRQFSGPLPSPQSLAQFEKVLPGTADRIISMAEKSQDHQHDWNDRALNSEINKGNIGMYGGLFVSILLVVGSVVCAFLGQTVVAVALVGASAIGLVGRLIDGPQKNAKNDQIDAPKKSEEK